MPTINQVAPIATAVAGVGVASIECASQLIGHRWGGWGLTLVMLTLVTIAAFAWVQCHVAKVSTEERHRMFVDQLAELLGNVDRSANPRAVHLVVAARGETPAEARGGGRRYRRSQEEQRAWNGSVTA